MTNLTELAAARLPNSSGDLLIILSDPDGMPASVIIHWPNKQPTAIDPARFHDFAGTIVQLFSDANGALTRIKGRRLW